MFIGVDNSSSDGDKKNGGERSYIGNGFSCRELSRVLILGGIVENRCLVGGSRSLFGRKEGTVQL